MKTIFILLLSFLFALNRPCYAGITVYSNYKDKPNISSVNPATTFNTRDNTVVDEINPLLFAVKRTNKVRMNYMRNLKTDVSNYFTYEVFYNLNKTGVAGVIASGSVKVIFSATSGASVYEDVQVHSTSEADVTLTVTGIASSGTVPNDIRLELIVATEKYIDLNTTTAPLINYTVVGNSLQLNWQYIVGAEDYDVEWVFVDFMDKHPVFNIPSDPFDYKPATSITTNKTWHSIDLTYPKGIVYFRVRPVGRYVAGVNNDYTYLKPGAWGYSTVKNGAALKYSINTGFEKNKNWQYQISFAEEGKNKMLLNYFDGSLRDRQDITKVSSDNTVLIGEKKYDSEGRAVVTVLPVPEAGKNLAYHSKFNQDEWLYEFEKSDFEGLSAKPKALSNTTGAGQYYSSLNPFLNSDPYAKYTPDAGKGNANRGGWPYSQVTYKRDGTGRVDKVSGVGPDHQIDINGSAQHQTDYYYGTANGTELHSMFGSNVGKASHYKKNLTKDANGQYSVAYADQEGRTIATALAGDCPSNLIELPSINTTPFTVSLNDNNIVDPNSLRTINVSKILNIPSTAYTFNYDMNGVIYTNSFTQNVTPPVQVSICEDCKYKLTITIRDPDGLLVAIQAEGDSLKRTISNPNSSPDCNNTSYILPVISFAPVASFTKAGEYTVTKILELDTSGFSLHIQNALNASGLGQSYLTNLIAQYQAAVDTTVCDITCDQHCRSQVRKEHPEWNPDNPGELTQINEAVALCVSANCGQIINTTIDTTMKYECASIYSQMELDVSADGPDGPGFEYAESCSATGGFWDRVKNMITTNPAAFQDANGNNIQVNSICAIMANPLNFRTEWIPNLVQAHREYCHYLNCMNDEASNAYDVKMAMPSGWNVANGQGYLNPLANNALVYISTGPTTDPWFATHAAEKNTLNGWMLNLFLFNTNYPNKTLWEFALDQNSAVYTAPFNMPFDDLHKYQVFRDLYQAMKTRLMEVYATSQPCPYYTDDNAIVQHLPDPTTTDPTELNNLINANSALLNDCASLCTQNVEIWMGSLKESCGLTVACAKYDSIKIELLAYCSESCGLANPLGVITNEIVAANTNSHLNHIKTWLAACTPCTNLTAISIPNPYTCSNQTLTYSQPSACMLDFVSFLNTDVFPMDTANPFVAYQLPATYINCVGVSYYTTMVLDWSGLNQYKQFGNWSPDGSGCGNFRIYACTNGQCSNYEALDMRDILHIDKAEYAANFPTPFTPPYPAVYYGIKLSLQTKQGTKTGYFVRVSCTDFTAVTTTTETLCVVNGFNETVHPYDISPDSLHKACVDGLMKQAEWEAQQQYNTIVNEFSSNYLQNHFAHCFAGDLHENLNYHYDKKEYHYTLYYYDQAGNLTQTVPPAGYVPVPASAFVGGVYNGITEPNHFLRSQYLYNSLNQLIIQESPDAGLSNFFYNLKGQLKVSQNAKQIASGVYSYTLYDPRGRITNVGEANFLFSPNPSVFEDDKALSDLIGNPNTTVSQVTKTYYDKQVFGLFTFSQTNLRSRVASVTINEGTGTSAYTHGTHYSYDIHGNVKELVQDNALLAMLGDDIRYKKTEYSYDLISGKVNDVIYQKDFIDQFYHHYEYDADNRITIAMTSSDNEVWEKDAKYFYYKHGPLARTETGEDKVQGIDYTYTLQGWIKGVNSNTLKESRDMGRDGDLSFVNKNKFNARDAFGYTLGYYDNDYHSINGAASESWQADHSGTGLSNTNFNLFNGNISHMVSAMSGAGATPFKTQGCAYQYDQLNRIKQSMAFRNVSGVTDLVAQNNSWVGAGNNMDYYEAFDYDANGNIMNLTRNGISAPSQGMDALSYKYLTKTGAIYIPNPADNSTVPADATNKLASVNDLNTTTTTYLDDIESGQGDNNYGYDEIGNLVRDDQEDIASIEWSVYGKIRKITRTPFSLKSDLEFRYDASGNRICKIEKPRNCNGMCYEQGWKYTYYARDAQGNTMAVYERDLDIIAGEVTDKVNLAEHHLYGSSRLGIKQALATNKLCGGLRFMSAGYTAEGVFIPTPGTEASLLPDDPAPTERAMDRKNYELSNHLGNVLEVVGDRKIGMDNNSDNKADYYKTNVLSANDYYAFGSPMPGRTYNNSTYRYGFNGQEKVDEISGNGNHNTAEFWEYDSRTGRRWNLDPIRISFESPYATFTNNPIYYRDPNGAQSESQDKGKKVFGPPSDDALPTIPENPHYDRPDPTGSNVLKEVVITAKAPVKIQNLPTASSYNVTITPINPMENDLATPYTLGLDWLLSRGKSEHNFNKDDPFTKLYRQHQHIKDAIKVVANELRFYNGECIEGNYSWSLSNFKEGLKYLKEVPAIIIPFDGTNGSPNPAFAFLGSHSLTYEVTANDIEKHVATVHFIVHNVSTLESATRPPGLGYFDSWSNSVGVGLNWFTNTTGILKPTIQNIEWSQEIKY